MGKKLIEIALPLEAINRESAREKSIRRGHPSTLHLWWARRPLAACRAVLFASLVDDPSSHPELFPTEEEQNAERQRLFQIITDLVCWENVQDEHILTRARAEIARYNQDSLPQVLDPFCGGGSIPLEAQRLGLQSTGQDLNPVAVLITKALVELPHQFAHHPPVNPPARNAFTYSASWHGTQGLAADVQYYGRWMRDKAEKQIGQLYPKVKLPAGGGEATIVAWLWARTVKCPNPACGAMMPLVKSFVLSTKKQNRAWIVPQIDRVARQVTFTVATGKGDIPTAPKLSRGASFKCLVCDQAASETAIRQEFQQKRNQQQLMAIVAEGKHGRIYLSPDLAQSTQSITLSWQPTEEMDQASKNLLSGRGYGIKYWYELFTKRQLCALTTFSDLVKEVHAVILADAIVSQAAYAETPFPSPSDPQIYADTVATYLAFAVDRLADRNSTICSWDTGYGKVRNTFARQAIPMTWDFAEANPFSESTGNFLGAIEWIQQVLLHLPLGPHATIRQQNSMQPIATTTPYLISTDPPYYDNIGYAELSDFFYIWLRHSLNDIYPTLFSTMLVPKASELVATTHRFGGSKEAAKDFFEQGLHQVFQNLRRIQTGDYPLTVYYAFKQTEEQENPDATTTPDIASTGWETILTALINTNFIITGTWPIRTELANRSISIRTNALASSVVLVCRPRPWDAPLTTRREFINALKRELREAVKKLQQGSIAPVDLAQAAIGPGMAIFSRYREVIESDGTPLSVRKALIFINQTLDEYFSQEEGDFDVDTRWALAWFEQYGLEAGPFGMAETLSKAKNTRLERLKRGGILTAQSGKVRLLRRDELPANWNAATEKQLTVWAVTQQLIQRLTQKGELSAAQLLRQTEDSGHNFSDAARDLAYRLYATCERKKWGQEALVYNTLVQSWPEILQLARRPLNEDQLKLF
jgi:putative DNA methylase